METPDLAPITSIKEASCRFMFFSTTLYIKCFITLVHLVDAFIQVTYIAFKVIDDSVYSFAGRQIHKKHTLLFELHEYYIKLYNCQLCYLTFNSNKNVHHDRTRMQKCMFMVEPDIPV